MNTLFVDTQITVNRFKSEYNVAISNTFLSCADTQLTAYFIKKTGLTPNKNVCIAWVIATVYFYQKDEISKLPFEIYVNNNWNPVVAAWKSVSGRIYDIIDNDIDCNDIEFWFEGLDPVLYHKQLYPKEQLPLKLKDLSFELVVVRINVDATIVFTFKDDSLGQIDDCIKKIDLSIQKFIDKPIKIGNEIGVAHNFRRKGIAVNKWEYDVDTGSTGVFFYKKLLPILSKLNCLKKVEIE